MIGKIAVIGNELICTGFTLAGVSEVVATENAEEARKALQSFLERQDIAIIGITSGIYRELAKDQAMKRRLETSVYPMVVELPEYGEKPQEDVIRSLIIRAIGIDLER